MKAYKGVHYVGDLECTIIPENLSGIVRNIIMQERLTIVGYTEHKFTPQGETFVFLLAESHMSVHTWPEHNKIAVDVYTCNNTGATHRIVEQLHKVCGVTAGEERYIKRL